MAEVPATKDKTQTLAARRAAPAPPGRRRYRCHTAGADHDLP